ncbi:MFS transporter [Brevibacterium sp. BDJS002]|uniref:MFS transporter n=1 Tax=Brevibacterium sp. BDJS002 TaxID=3020906 RepID=UPI0023080EF4|nr:MFS transporter [Brevibacterium sp. BDJS002]WCE41206.1 MFS transporter [Brevibacterium sp. BDJS002]
MTTTHHAPAGAKSPRQAAVASLIGTMIEWYDFFVYSTAAALVFNHLFFPNFDPTAGTLLAFSTFTAGFIARPIGAAVFGHFGDRIGRKPMMVLTILIMGIATVLIGCLPSYDSIGTLAPVLLVTLRIIQGLALGGEWGGAALMSTEHAPEANRGFFGSFTQAGLTVGLVLAMLVFLPLNLLNDAQMEAWGWRIPFLLSSIFVIVGILMRLKLTDTPDFKRVKKSNERAKMPLIEVVRKFPLQVIFMAGASMSSGILFYLVATYNLVYTADGSISRSFMQILVMTTSVLGFFVVLAAGKMSDRFPRHKVYLFGLILIAIIAVPLYGALDSGNAGFIVVTYILATIALYIPYAVQPAFFSTVFSADVRYSGLSLGVTLGHLVGSSIAPLIAGALVAATGSSFAVAGYLLVATVISFVSVIVLVRLRRPAESALEPSVAV